MKRIALALLAPLVACQNSPPSSDGMVLLQPREQLIRLSVDLRGIHPSEADLQAYEQNPATWNTILDAMIKVRDAHGN